MKKYNSPEIHVIEIGNTPIMAGSSQTSISEDGKKLTFDEQQEYETCTNTWSEAI